MSKGKDKVKENESICIVGGGWYGCHLALSLRKKGYDVTIKEKNGEIFSGISGQYGIRLHTGLHYPRSDKTRENCRTGFEQFKERYPELVVGHEHAYYGLGIKDADGNPSKVTPEEFLKVCHELDDKIDWKEVDPRTAGFDGLHTLIDVDEPSILLGDPLRDTFKKYLEEAGVKIECDCEVTNISKESTDDFLVRDKKGTARFDKVINATSYQAHLPKEDDFPFDMEVVYQPCLALVYEDTKPSEQPISFIVMDGWFPCMMPVCDNEKPEMTTREYIVTHGKWTIMGSFEDPASAKTILSHLDDKFVEANIKALTENEMRRFYPDFDERFKYVGWRGEVLAKLKTKKEFRSAFTYEKDGIIQIFPGKVSNIFDIESEVMALLSEDSHILESNGYRYVKDGVLDDSCVEITEKPLPDEPNTTNLQTFVELIREHHHYNLLCDPKYQVSYKYNPDNNYFFELQCLNRFFAGAAMVGTALVALLYFSALTAGVIATTGLVMMGYSTYSFFTRNRTAQPANPCNEFQECDPENPTLDPGIYPMGEKPEAVFGIV
jgi:glycine/D-amino acid oxidase-like deaminating enzyme